MYLFVSTISSPFHPSITKCIVQHWYINGNIKCFTGGHAPLGLLAIVLLALCLSIIPLPLMYSLGWLQVSSLTCAQIYIIIYRIFPADGPICIIIFKTQLYFKCKEGTRNICFILYGFILLFQAAY